MTEAVAPAPAAPAEAPAEAAAEDAAWVEIELPQPQAEVLSYLGNLQRFFRLNPYLDIRTWEEQDAGTRVRLHALNEMTGIERELVLAVDEPRRDGFRLSYDCGVKEATEVRVTPAASGCRLVIKERYRQATGAEAQRLLAEVDRSLTPWGVALRRHFLGLQRWGRLPGYRWWLEKVWLPMRPRERRISRLIVWTTAAEFVVFLFVVAIYWAESMSG